MWTLTSLSSGGECHNPNIMFVIKCRMQRPMRSRECVWVQNKLSQMGESAKDGAQ
jgi:hypothetical protein